MLRAMQNHEFDTVFELMLEAFPESEHRPRQAQKDLLSRPEYQIYVADLDGKICGFLALWCFDDFLFLEHLATDATVRNKGIGRSFLENVQKTADRRIILEVEPPENEITRRRIGFYERNEFTFNDYPYVQPSMAKDRPEIPLHLMSSGGPLTPEEFCFFRDQLYRSVYGIHGITENSQG